MLRNRDIFNDIYTENEWKTIEAAIGLYNHAGKQTIVIDNEEYDVVDSIANDDLIKELSNKLGRKGK